MKPLKQQFQQLNDAVNVLNQRERALIFLVLLSLPYAIWDLAFLTPMLAEKKMLRSSIDEQITSLAPKKIEAAMAEFKKTTDPNLQNRSRIKQLTIEIEGLDRNLKETAVQIIQPREMAQLLSQLLTSQTALELIKLENLPRKTIDINQGDETKPTQQDIPEIYQHGLSMTFKGDFMNTVALMDAFESLSWKIFWDDIKFEVDEYPNAIITITVHTISLDKGWIGV